jgi:hypothetical protein
MLIRARILRRVFSIFFRDTLRSLLPTDDEWIYIEYMINLTVPFNSLTMLMGRTQSPSIHESYDAYNALLQHLETAQRRLAPKKEWWKQEMRSAIQAAHEKLTKYYGMTSNDARLDNAYAFAWLLSAGQQKDAFVGDSWVQNRGKKSYRSIYINRLRAEWELKYKQFAKLTSPTSSTFTSNISSVRQAIGQRLSLTQRGKQPTHKPVACKDELTLYLENCEYILISPYMPVRLPARYQSNCQPGAS